MKKTLTINLGGTVFHIDDDAYSLLENYLNNLRHHFSREVGAEEIVDDIERRISELFAERLAGGIQVITITDVEEVIARVGRPEEMEGASCDAGKDADAGESESVAGESGGEPHRSERVHRRLYRDPDNKLLGGVVSGLAAYTGWDVTLLRLLLLLLAICGYGSVALVYVVCWLIIPEAQTAAEKLSMRGEPITVENIGKTVTGGFERAASGAAEYMKSDKPRGALHKAGNAVASALTLLFKICMVLFVIVFSPVLFALAVAFVGLLFAAVVVVFSGGAALVELFPMLNVSLSCHPLLAITLYISLFLLVGIPLFVLIWCVLSALFNWKPVNNGLRWTLLLLWVLSWVVFGICYGSVGCVFPELALLSV